ncbi:MAG: hypothetical protein Q4D98_01520 [Planctomycetia bacterium]|nr:hypothetical protein [Planctomycetia bacterium]
MKKFWISAVCIWVLGVVAFGQKWEVKDWKGMPCLWKDDAPVTPMMFWQWELQEKDVRDMSGAGMQIFSMFGSFPHYSYPYWKKGGAFGMEYQDANIRKLLEWSPNASFLPRIFSSAPDWWIAENPKENIVYTNKDATTTPRESFASRKFLDESGEMYRKAVRHLLTQYRQHLLGIHVTSGPWGEHFSWDAYLGLKNRPGGSDGSEPMRQAFIAYCRNKYGDDVQRLRQAYHDETLTFQTLQVPDLDERKKWVDDAWRDPGKSRWVPDYFECHHETTVRMIDHFCRIVKEESKGNLTTMVFYGYVQDEKWPIECDHRAPSKIYQLESVDMLSAPHTYHRRALGDDGEMRQYLASAALHGKLFVDEGDDMTHLERQKPHPDSRAHATNMEESLALLYREFGNTVSHGVGLWYMDLKKDTFRDPQLVDAVGRMKKWADESLKHSRRRCSEVAVISNPESEFYLGYRQHPSNNIGEGLYLRQMGAFYRAGAPFDWFLIDDLEAVEKGNYKVCIFLDDFFMTEKHREMVERLKSKNRTLIWFFAPGYVSENALSQERMERLIGFRLEKQAEGKLMAKNPATGETSGWNVPQKAIFTILPDSQTKVLAHGIENLEKSVVMGQKERDGWRSVFSAVPGMSPTLLRQLYREAGVHVYVDSDDVVLSANASWLSLHTREAGDYTLQLPRTCRKITEVTTEQVIAENTDTFTIPLRKFQTAVFLMEP